ncbi:unnamed protein product [Paramecium sonneborni]|uniref:Dynein light chain n=1 Tax=Paramecium sonneborni TaxID=65129 RepID=A0A8S1PV28_9CILI|nr:unnamed protein product [Paramecium sonneborni]
MSFDKLQPVIKQMDMSDEMQREVIEVSRQAIDKSSTDQQIASYIKDELRAKYHGTWHCIVGRNFGSYVTHETKHYIYFYIGQLAIMLFKTG